MSAGPDAIAEPLLHWYDRSGRHDLPWKQDRDPYRIWVSEIMLQQTQVTTVMPYFERFMATFPDVTALAAASEDAVLAQWTGLGYYTRARNLHRAARQVTAEHGGHLPADPDQLLTLPGIGRSTANAIAAMAFDISAAILDGNVKRVLTRLYGIEGWPGQTAVERRLWTLAEQLTPTTRCADYTQAIMDLGATLCTRRRPACTLCPLQQQCVALREGTTDRLPTPRPKREQPERSTVMLVIRDSGGRVLLQRRNTAGVWQGLWCFPESAAASTEAGAAEAAIEAAARLLQVPDDVLAAPLPLPLSRHTFTHYHLTIQPLLLDAPSQSGATGHAVAEGDAELRWFDPQDPPALGLAAPVTPLCHALADTAGQRDVTQPQ